MISSRLNFIKTASVLTAGSVLSPDALAKSRMGVSANDKIQVALVGANGMGFNELTSFLKNPEIECVALCDIDRDVALVAQMGNIAFRTGEKVLWDNENQSFKTPTANKSIVPEYHNGWTLPKY